MSHLPTGPTIGQSPRDHRSSNDRLLPTAKRNDDLSIVKE
jgi:hypothetical protein